MTAFDPTSVTQFPYVGVRSDPDAVYAGELELDLAQIEPMVALPGREDRGVAVTEAAGKKINQVFIGSVPMRV